MKFINKVSALIHSRLNTYILFILAFFAAIAVGSADWTYGWIAASYPLGEKFVPTFIAISAVCAAANLIYLFIAAFKGSEKKSKKALNIIHTVFALISVIAFVYSAVLLFGMDSGITAAKISNGLNAVADKLVFLALGGGAALTLVFCGSKKQSVRALIAGAVVCAIIGTTAYFSGATDYSSKADTFIQPQFSAENVTSGATISFESLMKNEKPDAENMLSDGKGYWSAHAPNGNPADGCDDANNAVAQIKLKQKSTFNTAVIEELGNEAQYFRLQAKIGDEWQTIYQSEKIQSLRLCSFDAVTTDEVRLSIDKFRDEGTPVKIKSFKLYNEKKRDVDDFEITAYQRLDGDVPTEILAKGDDYAANYAKYYDVYTTVIVFAAINWQDNGDIGFGDGGEEKFAREFDALKKIISMRSNKSHDVKLIVTTLSDGTWGTSVNEYMAKYWQKVEKQTVDFAAKYDIDGVDIDWEYPQSGDDWKNYDSFIQTLSADLKKVKASSIISTALSSSQLGLSKETYDCIDQIQFMAYDGNDTDGYQSSLEQAQEGLRDFKANGADISKINIGIAAYGRPINSTPFWATWRDLKDANYWNSKYYTVEDCDQIYEGTFCSPALAGDKAAYAMLSGAGGVMVFRVGCDKLPDSPVSVSRGLQNTMNRLAIDW